MCDDGGFTFDVSLWTPVYFFAWGLLTISVDMTAKRCGKTEEKPEERQRLLL